MPSWPAPGVRAHHLNDGVRDARDDRRIVSALDGGLRPLDCGCDMLGSVQILCRHVRRAAAEAPDDPTRFTEMLPEAEQCSPDVPPWRSCHSASRVWLS